jgi:hypothetical protein
VNITTYKHKGKTMTSKYGMTLTQHIRKNDAAQKDARDMGIRFCYQIWYDGRTGIIDLETGQQFVVEPSELGWQYQQLSYKARRGMTIELGPRRHEEES